MSRRRTIVRFVEAATDLSVVVGQTELRHAARHFALSGDLLLALGERILTEPTIVYSYPRANRREYRFFYRSDAGRRTVAIVKFVPSGAFFASMYPTGRRPRLAHSRLRRLR